MFFLFLQRGKINFLTRPIPYYENFGIRIAVHLLVILYVFSLVKLTLLKSNIPYLHILLFSFLEESVLNGLFPSLLHRSLKNCLIMSIAYFSHAYFYTLSLPQSLVYMGLGYIKLLSGRKFCLYESCVYSGVFNCYLFSM
jgi:hypothetical protein